LETYILNKPLDYTISDLIPEIEAAFKIYNGGPVEQDNLYFIHKIPDLIPNSIEISHGIFWGGDFTEVSRLITEDKIGKNDIKFFLGEVIIVFGLMHPKTLVIINLALFLHLTFAVIS